MSKDGFRINLSIFLFIAYIIFIIFNDYICYIFKADVSVLTYGSSFLILLSILVLLRKKIKIESDKFNKIDIVFFIFLLFIMFLRIAIPDSSFDTLNYHIYLQERLFNDNVNYNFFPGRWVNTFSLPLGDRLHYFFRLILGYRLGIIFNLICLIVVYYQLKRLLSKFISKQNLVCICSFVIIITEQILTNMITYYVDLFVIPVFLEIVIMLFEKDKLKINNYFTLLLAGLAVSLKVSNAILLIPLAIIYLCKYRKTINYKTFLIGIPLFVLPFAVYMINNYVQTGNPVFPFYNQIFKSEYVGLENWVEDAYGPKNLFERFFWPIFTLTNPRRAFDSNTYYGRIAFGYIFSLIAIIIALFKFFVKKEKFDTLFYISLLYVGLSIIWSNFMMGYIRYVLFLEILSGVVSMIFIYKYYNSNWLLSIFSILCILSLLYVSIRTISDLVATNKETSWRYSYYDNKEVYEKNLELLFYKKQNYDKAISDVDCFGIVDYNSGYAALLSDDIPIIDLHEGYNNNYGKKKLEKRVKECKSLYTISTTPTLYRTMEYIDELGYTTNGKIANIKVDFLNTDQDLILIGIEKQAN